VEEAWLPGRISETTLHCVIVEYESRGKRCHKLFRDLTRIRLSSPGQLERQELVVQVVSVEILSSQSSEDSSREPAEAQGGIEPFWGSKTNYSIFPEAEALVRQALERGICEHFLEGKCRKKKACKKSHNLTVCVYCQGQLPTNRVSASSHLKKCFTERNIAARTLEMIGGTAFDALIPLTSVRIFEE